MAIFLVGGTQAVKAQCNRQWTAAAPLATARASVAAVTGPDGLIYAMGGDSTSSSVEAYNPNTKTWAAIPQNLPTPRSSFAATTGLDGKIYVIGGLDINGAKSGVVEAYEPATGSWSTNLPSLNIPRFNLAATTGLDGKIYALGGITVSGDTAAVEVYDPKNPGSGWVQTTNPMSTTRSYLAAVTDPTGLIYAIGGITGTGDETSVETYNPAVGTWTAATSMNNPRYNFAAVTGLDGRIYAIGGDPGNSNTVEAYDWGTGTWTQLSSTLLNGRDALGAAAGLDGNIYAVGGDVNSSPSNLVEAYPTSTNWAIGPGMPPFSDPTIPYGRRELAAATGSDGNVYALGGE